MAEYEECSKCGAAVINMQRHKRRHRTVEDVIDPLDRASRNVR